MIVPPVMEEERRVEIPPVMALSVVVKKLDEVALVSVASVAVRVPITAVTALRSVAKKLDEVAYSLVRLVMVPVVLKSVSAVRTEDDALPRVV